MNANTAPDAAALKLMAARLRGRVVEMSHAAQAAHLASCLSCCDILAAAYGHALRVDPANPTDPDRDRFILSKGHAAAALYAVLAMRGYFDPAMLDTYCQDGGKLAEHPPAQGLPGVEAATGSLGHGLPMGAGMAMAARVQRRAYRVICVLSDGENNEGSVWEAAMFAAGQRLGNLAVVVDYNKWQATARSNETLALAPLREKWAAFGWDAHEVDGHDVADLARRLAAIPATPEGRPTALIAHTVKGRGVSFMEDDNNWHYRAPTAAEVQQAHRELGLA